MEYRAAITLAANVGEGLRAAAGDVLAEARAAIEQPVEAEAVHDFRRAMKRWRALLRLIEPFVGAEARQLRDQARDLARALAGARNAQSALDALADLEKHGPALPIGSAARLRRRLEEIRRAAETTTLNSDMRSRIERALAEAGEAVTRWPLALLHFEDVARALARFYGRARRLVPADWQAASGEELHELRKRVVIHRYQIEIFEPLWPRYLKMWTAEAQRLRDRLGKHQDVLMLSSLTAPHQPLARWRTRLAPALAERKAAHAVAAERIAERLFLEKPKALARRLIGMAGVKATHVSEPSERRA
jgi:CHAD domain-containing protein